MKSLTISITRGSEAEKINAYVVLHDLELARWEFRGRGDAEVFPGGVDAKSPLTQLVQEYWAYGLLWPHMPPAWSENRCKQAWRGLTTGNRAFTNGNGTDIYRDYISETNLGAADAAYDKFRVCGGGIVNVLGGDAATEKFGGVAHRKVETLDGKKCLPWQDMAEKYNYVITPWLVHLAVISSGNQVFPFPQLDGADVPFPLLSPGGFNFLPVEILRKIDWIPQMRAPCPYEPKRW